MLFDEIRLTDEQDSVKGLARFLTLTQPSDLSVMVGISRWYPPFPVVLKTVQCYVGDATYGAMMGLSTPFGSRISSICGGS